MPSLGRAHTELDYGRGGRDVHLKIIVWLIRRTLTLYDFVLWRSNTTQGLCEPSLLTNYCFSVQAPIIASVQAFNDRSIQPNKDI